MEPGTRPLRRTAAGVATALALGALLTSAAPAAAPVPPPRCHGAAARDPARPCENPALRRTVSPLPGDAVVTPDAPCRPQRSPGEIDVCTFGTPAAKATATVALLGDSHASHWRAALARVARSRGWHVVSLTKDSCPFTLATPRVSEEAKQRCAEWNAGVLRWLAKRPGITTVFTSAHTGARIVRTRGRNQLDTKVEGHLDAWAALPSSVRRIVVLRDVPPHPARTADCVTAAAAARKDAGKLCAVPRRTLLADPQAVAARTLPRTRVRVVDVTPVLCGAKVCYPVIGGVLVNKDTNHLTRRFSATLAPFVTRVTDGFVP